jgi:hypothetical protein
MICPEAGIGAAVGRHPGPDHACRAV